jgi:beta-xylosidase
MKRVMEWTTPIRQRAPDAMLPGDYPDPSVLRVGETFYLTTSSFEYYPGLLIWKSTDLIRWRPDRGRA